MQKIDPITQEEWLSCNEYNREILDEFLENSPQLSEQTKKVYRSNLMIWFNYVRESVKNKPEYEIKSLDYMKFQNKLINLGHSSSDINNKRAAISSLNNYIALFYEDDLPTFKNFIARGMPRPESQLVNKKEPPTKDEMALLIKTMEDRGDWQKAAYLRYTFDTGCRRAESIQLLKEVVNYKPIIKEKEIFNPDGSKSTVTVKYYQSNETRCKGRGKTGKVRRLVFGEETMQAIKKWLEMRGDDDCSYVFAYRRGESVQQITQTTLNRWASNVFTPILGRRFHPHILREARATSIVVEEGKSLEAAQKLLGHNSSDTTKIYVVRDDEDEEIDELYSI